MTLNHGTSFLNLSTCVIDLISRIGSRVASHCLSVRLCQQFGEDHRSDDLTVISLIQCHVSSYIEKVSFGQSCDRNLNVISYYIILSNDSVKNKIDLNLI